MINFCTLFDSYYLHKGIALYLSLLRQNVDFHLYVMAFDRDSFKALKNLSFDHMTVECMCDYEDDFFLKLKTERNKAEYCWTCGPFVIHHFLVNYKLPAITYLDSDLFFIGNPQIAFNEIGDNSVAITEQGVSEESSKKYGKYCVQFMYFKNDQNSLSALEWWRDACYNWCYQRVEDGKFGDQKYLDYFPQKFKNVYVIKNPGVGIAPWNVHRHKFKNSGLSILGEKKYDSVFFHMHGVRVYVHNNELLLDLDHFFIKNEDREYFFNPYAELMLEVFNKYLGQNILDYKVKGVANWRKLEFLIRSKLSKVHLLKKIYHKIHGETEHNHGTKIVKK